jgi:hypothetical protein
MSAAKPWYREPWPWILMSGPAAVVLAGAATIWIAMASSDGLVAEDYYKQGLAINKRLAREQAAERLGVSAEIVLEPGRMQVRLHGTAPEALFAHLAHATRAGHDLRVRLAHSAGGAYEAELPALAAGRWHVVVEDPQGTWRIARDSQ